MSDTLMTIGKVVLAVVIGVPLVLWLLQDRLLFYPQPSSGAQRAPIKAQFGFAQEIVLQAGDGTRLHAWHVPAKPGAPLILYFGGNAENVAWMIPEAAAHTPGTGWLLVDYRGYGGSEGAPSETNIKADALQWHDEVALPGKPSRIYAFGRSLGTGAAVFLASQRPVAKVVLVTPYDSMVEVAAHHYPWLPGIGRLLRHRFDSIALAPKIAVPLLCVAAQRDEIIPSSHARKLYEAWGGPKDWVLLEEAGHNTTDSHPLFWQNVDSFLNKTTQ